MLVTKITDHVQQALNRLMQQYRGLTRFSAILTALIQQVQDIEDAAFDVGEKTLLFNGTDYPSTGAQLDGIGELINLKRNGLDDAEYLVFILGVIAENFSDTTIFSVTNIALSLLRPQEAHVIEMFPAEVDLEVANPLVDPSLYNTVAVIIRNALGAGIGLGFVVDYDLTEAFTIGDDDGNGTGLGFGDDLDPTVGGKFASDIYTNSEA